MHRVWWGSVVAVVSGVVLMGCPPPGKCGGQTCSVTQRCEQSTLLCVDDLPPVLVIDPVPAVVSTPTFVVTGKLTDDEGLREAQWRAGAREWSAIDLMSDGTFAITVDAPEFDAQKLVVTVRGTDTKGREATESREVTIDRVAPVISLVSPSDGAALATSSFTVVLKATDGSGSLSSLTVNGNAVSAPSSGAEVSTSIQIPASANGTPITVTAVAADARGNSATQTFTFFGDRVAPVISVVSPATNAWVTSATFVIDALVTEPGALRSVVFRIGTTDVPGTAGMNGHWTASLPTEVVERDETITITATDAAGNVGTTTHTVKVDRIAPTVAIQAPTAGVFRAPVALSVQTSASASVRAELEGAMATLTGGPTAWTGSVPVAAHDYAPVMLTVTATDEAGNQKSESVMIAVDTVAPVVTFTSPAPGQRFKISDFATSPNVVTTFTVVDGDAQAPTWQVNGVASTATSVSTPTNATDNGATYTTTVVAIDRAGNTKSATLNFVVDRVAPTVTTWTPAANTRNIRSSQAVFSEPMTGGAALSVVGQTATGSWTTATTYTLPLDAFPYRVIDLAMSASLTDLAGNPLTPPANRKVHVATGFANGSLVTLDPGAREFDVSTDFDGIAVTAVVRTNNTLAVYKDVGGSFAPLTPHANQPTTNVSRAAINSWNVVDGAALTSSQRIGMGTLVGSTYYQHVWVDSQTAVNNAGTNAASVVSHAAVTYEPGANGAVGMINGTTYQREFAGTTYTLPFTTNMSVINSDKMWATFGSDASNVLWTRFYCGRTPGGTLGTWEYFCDAPLFSVATASMPSQVQGAVSPNRACLAVTWTAGGSRYAAFQPRPMCEDASPCLPAGSPSASQPYTDLRVGAWGANGENSLLFSYRTGSTLVLAKMDPSQCGPTATQLGSWTVTNAKAHAPVRIGNQAALLYIDASDVLKLQLAP